MGLPSRKARRITVNGVDYDWIESVNDLATGNAELTWLSSPRSPAQSESMRAVSAEWTVRGTAFSSQRQEPSPR